MVSDDIGVDRHSGVVDIRPLLLPLSVSTTACLCQYTHHSIVCPMYIAAAAAAEVIRSSDYHCFYSYNYDDDDDDRMVDIK